MADDTQTTIPIVNGNGTALNFLGTVNGASQYTFQSTPRVLGALVDFTNPMPTLSKPAPYTLSLPNVGSVTTGGTAVLAFTSGQRNSGGWIYNPGGTTGTAMLGIAEVGTASGTVSSGNTTFISAGQTYTLAPSTNAVSVISADSGHVFTGLGYS